MSKKLEELPIVGGIYRHFKFGDLYKVTKLGGMDHEGRKVLEYVPLYKCSYDFFVQPIDRFFDPMPMLRPPAINHNPTMQRFELVQHPPAAEIADQIVSFFKLAESVGIIEDFPISSCSYAHCLMTGSEAAFRHLCCDPRCPMLGTPGYKSSHP